MKPARVLTVGCRPFITAVCGGAAERRRSTGLRALANRCPEGGPAMGETFLLATPLWEIAARGTAVYLAIALVFRLMPKRHTGGLAPNDMIALVIVGSVAADAIMGDAKALPDLLLMVLVIILWDYLFNLAEYYFPRFRGIAQDSPTLLIHHGVLLKDNLRREKLTEQALAASLRKQGVSDMTRVQQAVLEVDGQICVVEED
jgi:uncharacterized membrane protein YcaP (DUF421 family)